MNHCYFKAAKLYTDLAEADDNLKEVTEVCVCVHVCVCACVRACVCVCKSTGTGVLRVPFRWGGAFTPFLKIEGGNYYDLHEDICPQIFM